ncbi:hypothetical protein [Streptomyces venezuelae]
MEAKRMPHNTCRSGIRGLPSTGFDPGMGNNSSTSGRSSSEMIHGRD